MTWHRSRNTPRSAFPTHSFADPAYREPESWMPHFCFVDKALCMRESPAVYRDLLEFPYCAAGIKLCRGLGAGAEDRQTPDLFGRQHVRCHTGRPHRFAAR